MEKGRLQGKQGIEEGDLDVGDVVIVTFAPEKFAPIQYHSFDVGPFSAETKVREGETAIEAMRRAYKVCRKMAQESYVEKRDDFLAHVEDAATVAQSRARR